MVVRKKAPNVGACSLSSLQVRLERYRETDRTKVLASTLTIEFARAKNLGVGQFDVFVEDARTNNEIRDRDLFINAVTMLEGVAIEKDIAGD
jgi:hypothetical protein